MKEIVKELEKLIEDLKKGKYYGHPMFYRIMLEELKLHSDKNKQYATQNNPLANFQRTGRLVRKLLKPNINPALASAMILMSKQIDAVYEMVGEGKKNTVEELEDKFKDISIYANLCIIILREMNERHRKNRQRNI